MKTICWAQLNYRNIYIFFKFGPIFFFLTLSPSEKLTSQGKGLRKLTAQTCWLNFTLWSTVSATSRTSLQPQTLSGTAQNRPVVMGRKYMEKSTGKKKPQDLVLRSHSRCFQENGPPSTGILEYCGRNIVADTTLGLGSHLFVHKPPPKDTQ
nr:LOW QUALITY PROTEIN: folate transporter-like protein C2orf83 [Microcebus murinus]